MMVASQLPIRWRLVLWYAVLVTVTIALFASGLFLGLRHFLYASLDDTLHSQAALTAAAIEIHGGVPTIPAGSVFNPQPDGQFIRLVDQSGQVVADTGADAGQPFSNPEGQSIALTGGTDLRWINPNRQRVRVLSQPIWVNGAIAGAMQIGIRDDEITEALNIMLLLSGILGPMVLVVVSVGGIWFARRALAPVTQIANLAAEIEAHDLSRRIDADIPYDEVGRLARTFNAMLDRLESEFRRQRQFTADASHELRNPLALLQSQLEVALVTPRAPVSDQQIFGTLAEDVDRLSHIAGALLALARGDAGTLEFSRDEFDLAGILNLVAEQYGPRAKEAGVTIVVDTVPTQFIADEDRLVQLLVNLVDNALRATPCGGQITFGCRSDDDQVRIWVSDTGCGIAPAHLPHVFERFYRADAARDRSHGGVGLGLNISRSIVEGQGGTIVIASEVGLGTTVTIRLPLRPVVSRHVTAS